MFVIRDTFRCKPGKSKELVAKFKTAAPHFEELGVHQFRVLVDRVGHFWTVVLESEVESVEEYWRAVESRGNLPAVRDAMAGYMDLVVKGKREIFQLE